jgi:hypothetical protein
MHGYAFAGIYAAAIYALFSAESGDLGAQSDLIGASEPMSIEAVLAVPNSGTVRFLQRGAGYAS